MKGDGHLVETCGIHILSTDVFCSHLASLIIFSCSSYKYICERETAAQIQYCTQSEMRFTISHYYSLYLQIRPPL
jgi:hypothetical protein